MYLNYVAQEKVMKIDPTHGHLLGKQRSLDRETPEIQNCNFFDSKYVKLNAWVSEMW